MRNKTGYINMGGQLDQRPVLNAHNLRPDWTDAALARLVADVRKDEKRCVSDFVSLDFTALEERVIAAEIESIVSEGGAPVYYQFAGRIRRDAPERAAVPVEEIKPGDRIFMSADQTPRTVLHVHTSRYFITFTVVSADDAIPFLINRHPGAVIYKEV